MSQYFSNTFSIKIQQPPEQLPAWLSGKNLLTWVEIPNTAMTSTGSGTGITSYSGACMRGSQMLVWGGGHTDYYGNEVIACDLSLDNPVWQTIGEATPPELRANAVLYYGDGKPSAKHSYWTLHWVPQHGRMFQTGGITAFNGPYVTSLHMDGFNPITGEWDEGGGAVWPDVMTGSSAKASVFTGNNIWEMSPANGRLYRCDISTMQWTDCGGLIGSHEYETPLLYDPVRNRLFRPKTLYGGPQYLSLDGYTSGLPPYTNVTFTGVTQTRAWWGKMGAIYCADRDSYLCLKWQDSTFTIYEINPNTFEVTYLPISGSLPPMPGQIDAKQNYYGRFSYVPELKGVVLAHRADGNIFFFRTG